MHDLSGFQRDVLYVLATESGLCGLSVKRQLSSYYPHKQINDAQLYPNLERLEEKGMVNKEKRDGRTNEYKLTPRGGREIEARREWEETHIEEATMVDASL